MTNQPNIDDVLCEMCQLGYGCCHYFNGKLQGDGCEHLIKAKQKLGEMIEGCLYYTVNSKRDFIGISASIKNLTKLGLLPERS